MANAPAERRFGPYNGAVFIAPIIRAKAAARAFGYQAQRSGAGNQTLERVPLSWRVDQAERSGA
jgi:hypothetical protein